MQQISIILVNGLMGNETVGQSEMNGIDKHALRGMVMSMKLLVRYAKGKPLTEDLRELTQNFQDLVARIL